MGANLHEADLSDADLTDTYLRDANLMRANLSDADLTNANLMGANLTNAILAVVNLKPEIIKKACYWEKAIYIPVPDSFYFQSSLEEGSKEYKQREIDRAENQRKIEEMKQDKASDPKPPVDCSKWEGK